MVQQTMQPQQQQVLMPTPPPVITTKDFLYLKDAMAWELSAAKKSHHYAGECTCQETKQLLEKSAQGHQRNYQTLLKKFQHRNAEEMSKIPQPQQ